jgi:signal peptidase II
MRRWLVIALTVLVLDQITKLAAAKYLVLHDPVNLLPILNLTLIHNTGAAFGFLSSASGWQNLFFVAVAVVACIAIIFMLRHIAGGNAWVASALALILGGAAGNLVDRLMYGYVIDFVDVFVGTWHWPAFNVADSAISVGAVILVLDTFGTYVPGAKSRPEAGK